MAQWMPYGVCIYVVTSLHHVHLSCNMQSAVISVVSHFLAVIHTDLYTCIKFSELKYSPENQTLWGRWINSHCRTPQKLSRIRKVICLFVCLVVFCVLLVFLLWFILFGWVYVVFLFGFFFEIILLVTRCLPVPCLISLCCGKRKAEGCLPWQTCFSRETGLPTPIILCFYNFVIVDMLQQIEKAA